MIHFRFSLIITCILCLCSTLDLQANENSIEQLISQFNLRESKVASAKLDGWKKPKTIILWGDQQQKESFQESFPDIEFIASDDIAKVSGELKSADGYIGYCIPQLFEGPFEIHWIHSLAVGVEGCVNAETVQQAKVVLTNSQRLSAPEIAEHAIAMMFSLVRRLDQYSQSQTKGIWDQRLESGDDKIWEIEGKTMLVVGLGGIGSETARRAHGLGMHVIATRNSSRQGPDYVDYVGLSDELFKLAEKADVIINAVPLTPKTKGIFNRKFFKAMKPSAYFVNIARGKSVVTDDLLAALKAGELAGAGLDVTDPEPLPEDHPLWVQPRVIITPHIAYRSEKLKQRVLILAKENLRRYVNGDKLLSVVDINKGY